MRGRKRLRKKKRYGTRSSRRHERQLMAKLVLPLIPFLARRTWMDVERKIVKGAEKLSKKLSVIRDTEQERLNRFEDELGVTGMKPSGRKSDGDN